MWPSLGFLSLQVGPGKGLLLAFSTCLSWILLFKVDFLPSRVLLGNFFISFSEDLPPAVPHCWLKELLQF